MLFVCVFLYTQLACDDAWVSSGIYWEKHSGKYPFPGNNAGACSMIFLTAFTCMFEYIISCNLPGVCGPWVLRREKLVMHFFGFFCNQIYAHILFLYTDCICTRTHIYINTPIYICVHIRSTHVYTKSLSMCIYKIYIRCYTVCTHNRIRSPRLAAFGRIETRWVREVGKFGPYLRYKDWLRRRLLALYVAIVCFFYILLYNISRLLLFCFFYIRHISCYMRSACIYCLYLVYRWTLMFHNISFENWHGLGESDCLIKT